MNENTDDVLDLFPEDGDLFAANENEKKSTPNFNSAVIPASINPIQISPIAFSTSDSDQYEPIPIVKLGVGNAKRAVSSRLGELLLINILLRNTEEPR